MIEFRALPPMRTSEGRIQIWYSESKPLASRLTWIRERLMAVPASPEDEETDSVFIYGDRAIAWFDKRHLHYVTPEALRLSGDRLTMPSELALALHQAIARTGSVEQAIAEWTR